MKIEIGVEFRAELFEAFSEAKSHSTSPANLAVVFVTFVLNLAFSLSLLCFVVMHISLLSSNTASVEVHEKRRATRWKYDLGRKNNFEQRAAADLILWDLQNNPDMWLQVVHILQSTNNLNTVPSSLLYRYMKGLSSIGGMHCLLNREME